MMQAQQELTLLVRSRLPFLALHGAEEARLEDLMGRVARGLDMPLYIWSVTQGMRRAGSLTRVESARTLPAALEAALRMAREALYIFRDLQRWLDDVETERRLLDVARHFQQDRRTLILVGPGIELPERLRPLCGSWTLPLPGEDQLRTMTRSIVRDFAPGMPVELALDAAQLDQLVDSLKGMSWSEAEDALRRCVADDLVLSDEDRQTVLALRRRVLREGGALEYIQDATTLSDVAGLENLKRWLAIRRNAFASEARAFGLPPPKGVLLLGVQGCGKSLAAKAVARDWGLPLLRMDVGRIYDKYIGESDKRLDAALAAADRMAPCVLWIDEMEKAFSGTANAEADGGLSHRLLGRLLGWMQDRQAAVFLVATCNDAARLPPEMMRKGRFDEVFFVDLPDAVERRAIAEVHLRRRERDPATFDLDALVEASAGFSGAEIEQAVVSALYAAFAEGTDLDTLRLLDEMKRTQPLSVLRRESVAALRSWAQGRTVPAGSHAIEPEAL